MDHRCGWHKNDWNIWHCFRPRAHSGPCMIQRPLPTGQIAIVTAPTTCMRTLTDHELEDMRADIRELLSS